MAPSKAARRRRRRCPDYPDVRVAGEKPEPGLWYNTSSDSEEFASDAPLQSDRPRRKHFSGELRKMVNKTYDWDAVPIDPMMPGPSSEMIVDDGLKAPSTSNWAEASEADDPTWESVARYGDPKGKGKARADR